MENTRCIVCGKEIRVERGTRRLDHTCIEHQGQAPEAVLDVVQMLNLGELTAVVESNAARATILTLNRIAEVCEANAATHDAQLESGRVNRFDSATQGEIKGERNTWRAAARLLRRAAHDLNVLVLTNQD